MKVDPRLGGQWKVKEKVPVLGGQWKVKEKVPVLGGQWKVKEKVPVLDGQWKVKEKVPHVWWPMEGERKILFTSPHFSPNQIYLNFPFFPLTLRFYFTMF